MTRTHASSYSLGRRLTRLFAVQTLLGSGALSAAIYLATAVSLSRKADSELSQKAELVNHLVREASTSGESTMRHKLDEFFMSNHDIQVTLFGTAGEVMYRSPGRVPEEAAQRVVTLELPRDQAPPHLVRAQLSLDREDDAGLLAALASVLVVATIFGAAALSLSGAWMVRGSLAPLRGLADQIRSLRAGRLGQRLTLSPAIGELQPWIDQFNELLVRLEALYGQLKSFNADVAHELCTPLATLVGQTELALARRRTVEEMRETLASNLEETRRMSSIVNDMLFLARADSGAQARAMLRASPRSDIEQVIEFHEAELAERALTVSIEGDIHLPFEPGLVRRAGSNLLGDAIRYAVPGTAIACTLRQNDGRGWIEVTNVGAALPAESLPRLFDRFYRLQASREGSSGNHGLGLAIVAAIARMHGGQTSARNADGRTTIGFSLSLRAARSGPIDRPGSVPAVASD